MLGQADDLPAENEDSPAENENGDHEEADGAAEEPEDDICDDDISVHCTESEDDSEARAVRDVDLEECPKEFLLRSGCLPDATDEKDHGEESIAGPPSPMVHLLKGLPFLMGRPQGVLSLSWTILLQNPWQCQQVLEW